MERFKVLLHLEDRLEKIGGRLAGDVLRGSGLQPQEILHALEGVLERPVGLVQDGGIGQAHGPLHFRLALEEVGVENPAQLVELGLQTGSVNIELARKSEAREVVHVLR